MRSPLLRKFALGVGAVLSLAIVAGRRAARRPAGPRAENDALNEYISRTRSAVFARPLGAREGGYVGEGLLEEA